LKAPAVIVSGTNIMARFPGIEKAGELSYVNTGPDVHYHLIFIMMLDCKDGKRGSVLLF
jgi:hypothetical protein